MITALSTYTAMTEASLNTTAGQTVKVGEPGSGLPASTVDVAGVPTDAVSVDISASADVFSAVDSFFNLGSSGRFDDFHKLSKSDKEQFVTIVAELAKKGYVGYEELMVNNRIERHEILNQAGDQRLHKARVWDEKTHSLK